MLYPDVIVCNIADNYHFFNDLYLEITEVIPNAKLILVTHSYNINETSHLASYPNIVALMLAHHKEVELPYALNAALKIHDLNITNRDLEAEIEFKQYRFDQSLKHKVEELQEKLHSKNRFISILAHDLKVAFNNLIGFSDILMTDFENLDKDTKLRFIAKIKNLSENTFKLFKNILKWNEAQKGEMQKSPSTLNLFQFFNDLVDLYNPHASNKNIQLTSLVPDEFEIFADRNMMSTLFRNLISNAIKFTPANGEIIIRAAEMDGEIHVQVEDTGVGIPESTLKRLFRDGEKISTHGTSKEEGTGLGLLLCKEMAELNNGKISAESTVGHGSRFTVRFPVVFKPQLSAH